MAGSENDKEGIFTILVKSSAMWLAIAFDPPLPKKSIFVDQERIFAAPATDF